MSSRVVEVNSIVNSLPVDDTDNMPTSTNTTTPNASPFLLRVQDVDVLAQSDGFNILRDHLAQHYRYDLCDRHTPAHVEDASRWLIVRDVLHALLVPIVELFDKAANLAATATHATKLEDLEYAFNGQARSAFLWLQCFLSNEREREWCYTRGCPACVVEHSLDSEFSVRLLFAACLLSDVHYPFTLDGPTLPSFMFFIDSLERALVEDPLYGSTFLELTQPKALATRNGIEELIQQCMELDAILSQQSSPSEPSSVASSTRASPVLAPIGANPSAGRAGMKIKRSKLARRQMTLQIEEEQWMEEMLKRCWDQLQPAQQAGLMPVPAQSLDAVLKAEPSVAVQEVVSDG